MKHSCFYYLLAIIFLFISCSEDTKLKVSSPDNRLELTISTQGALCYAVTYDGKQVVMPSAIGLDTDRYTLRRPALKQVTYNEYRDSIQLLYGKFNSLDDSYNQMIIEWEDGLMLEARGYDEGVAYRFITKGEGDMIVYDELMECIPVGDPGVIFPETGNYTSWELMYMDYSTVSAIEETKKAITPVLFSLPERKRLVVAESDVRDYPGMYLKKEGEGFRSDLALYPDSVALGSWGFVAVVQTRKEYIAHTKANRTFPWRVFIVTDDDRDLLVNEVIYKLATPSVLKETDWIRPGKAAWEWWHDAMLPDTDIPSGMPNRNTALYKHYIDFAAENRLEYLMIDAGWSDIFDLSAVQSRVDIQDVIRYGLEKNVGVFLWCVATALTDRIDEFMQMMHEWGAVGIKVDFFDRDDQLAMEWYETIASKAAAYKLMVNFHGCSKPTGMQRTYPNIVNFEAVRGAECSKWDLTANPQHHVTIPFTRMLGGAMDYTPGGMRNRSQQMFRPVDPGLPFVQGTRCHQLAMFVVFDQYFAMLCDSPSEYRKYPDILRFLSHVPVDYDYTIPLEASVGEYAAIAKQKGEEWYVGGMTNWTGREVNLDFSFLPAGKKYKAEWYKDGYEAGLYAEQYIYEESELVAGTHVPVKMAPGGGFVLRLSPAN